MAARTPCPTQRAALVFLAGGGILAVLAAAVDSALWTCWLAFLFLALLFLGADMILGPRLDRIVVRLKVPPRLFVAAGSEGALIIDNPGRRPFVMRLKLDVSKDLEEIPQWRGAAVPPGRTRLAIPLRPRRRGLAAVESCWMEASGPLGLMSFRRRVNFRKKLPVHPDLNAVSREAIRFFSARTFQAGARVERFRGDGTEFDHLREYLPGFDIRSVDWKASARHARMYCREYRAERNRQVLLAVDSGRLMMEPLLGLPRLDHAIHAALTLAYVSLHVGDLAGLFSFDDRIRLFCPPLRGPGAIGRLGETASRIDYSQRETNFTLSLMELARRQRRRALVVVLSDFVDTITAELMIENLTRVQRRHLVLFVAIEDPLLRNNAEREPCDLLGLHRSVVAHRLLRERALVFSRLRRRGVNCVSAPPGRVSPRLIDRYLDFKRREAF